MGFNGNMWLVLINWVTDTTCKIIYMKKRQGRHELLAF